MEFFNNCYCDCSSGLRGATFIPLSYSFKNSTKQLLTPYKPESEIKSHFHISNPLLKEFNKNFIYIGDPSELNYMINNKKITLIDSIDTNFKKQPVLIYEVIF